MIDKGGVYLELKERFKCNLKMSMTKPQFFAFLQYFIQLNIFLLCKSLASLVEEFEVQLLQNIIGRVGEEFLKNQFK